MVIHHFFAVTGYHVVGHVSIIVAGFRAGRVPSWFAAGVDLQCVCSVHNHPGSVSPIGIRSYLRKADQGSGHGARRLESGVRHTFWRMSILSRLATPPWILRRIFEIAST
jgi:hypothetical protein